MPPYRPNWFLYFTNVVTHLSKVRKGFLIQFRSGEHPPFCVSEQAMVKMRDPDYAGFEVITDYVDEMGLPGDDVIAVDCQILGVSQYDAYQWLALYEDSVKTGYQQLKELCDRLDCPEELKERAVFYSVANLQAQVIIHLTHDEWLKMAQNFVDQNFGHIDKTPGSLAAALYGDDDFRLHERQASWMRKIIFNVDKIYEEVREVVGDKR